MSNNKIVEIHFAAYLFDSVAAASKRPLLYKRLLDKSVSIFKEEIGASLGKYNLFTVSGEVEKPEIICFTNFIANTEQAAAIDSALDRIRNYTLSFQALAESEIMTFTPDSCLHKKPCSCNNTHAIEPSTIKGILARRA